MGNIQIRLLKMYYYNKVTKWIFTYLFKGMEQIEVEEERDLHISLRLRIGIWHGITQYMTCQTLLLQYSDYQTSVFIVNSFFLVKSNSFDFFFFIKEKNNILISIQFKGFFSKTSTKMMFRMQRRNKEKRLNRNLKRKRKRTNRIDRHRNKSSKTEKILKRKEHRKENEEDSSIYCFLV